MLEVFSPVSIHMFNSYFEKKYESSPLTFSVDSDVQ